MKKKNIITCLFARFAVISSFLVSSLVFAEERKDICINVQHVGVIVQEKTSIGQGSGFVAGRKGNLVTCSHVTPDDKQYELITIDFTKVGKNKNIRHKLDFKYRLPRFDLAVFGFEGKKWPEPLPFGDLRTIRPGDPIAYMGWDKERNTIQQYYAIVSACGQALNEDNIIDFIEFKGHAMPGYSGGPVVDKAGKVVAIIREAWTKKGVRGGDEILMNRAFSIEILAILDCDIIMGVSSNKNEQQNISLINASRILNREQKKCKEE